MKKNKPMPEFAVWESTLICNMTCYHCGLGAGRPGLYSTCIEELPGWNLSTNEAMSMFEELLKMKVRRLIISGGEFIVRPDWKGLLQRALNKFDNVRLISNGFGGQPFLRELETLKNRNRLILSVSLDGLRETHDEIRREGSFEKTVDILRCKSSILRTVITTVINENFNDLEGLFKLFVDLRVKVWAIQIGLPAGRLNKKSFIGLGKARLLADKIKNWQMKSRGSMEIVADDCFGYGHEMRSEIPWTGCPAGKRLICILSNGGVCGCPTASDEVCGNIREQRLKDIWEGEKMESFRRYVPHCSNCDNVICLGGCRAVQKTVKKQLCF
ncbi:MAG: radical SAM protein [bacterium]|nr:radical SAM protein [bacterium]